MKTDTRERFDCGCFYGVDTGWDMCRVHAAAEEMRKELQTLVERLDRDVPRHFCPGFDCATCARPSTADARALLARIGGDT